MEIEGHIYYQGVCYDDDGHCDEYDLMFIRADNGEVLRLNRVDNPVQYTKCKSPYWDRERKILQTTRRVIRNA